MLTSILHAILGGCLIGAAASWLMLAQGRVAGISGIVEGLLGPAKGEQPWRASFLAGLVVGGIALVILMPDAIAAPEGRPLGLVALAGALVGYGTRLGSGCTSGHGVCGLSRLSRRSLAATAVFMATGAAAATLMGLLT